MSGTVDYSLARRALLRDLQRGRVCRRDVCDAHPDLIRAANYGGEQTADACPVCATGRLQLVSYIFSDEFSKRENGKVWQRSNLAPLMDFREVRLYTVEVCVECSWHHLRTQIAVGKSVGGRGRRRGRQAST